MEIFLLIKLKLNKILIVKEMFLMQIKVLILSIHICERSYVILARFSEKI